MFLVSAGYFALARIAHGGERVGFTASPKVSLFQFEPVPITARFYVSEPDELNCADWEIQWGDGSKTGVEAWCDTYDPPKRWSESRTHDYKSTGNFTLTLFFFHTFPNGKTKLLRKLETEVLIR